MNKLRQVTLGFVLMAFLATVVLPSAILLWPKKTEAQSSCIAGIISNLFGSLGGMLGGMGGGEVPTKDSATRGNTQKTSGYTGGSFVSDCIIKPLVKNLVKQLIHSFLTSIVDWINDGFDGSGPRFVSDPASFFADIADRAIGQVVMGTDLNFLCSPFQANIRLSLGLSYWGGGGGFRERIGCTLSDIQQNVQNAFMGGQWDPNGSGEGWQNWINLTTIPQNNPYGAFLIAQDEINMRIANQQLVAKTEADWGAGFLSTKRCVEEDTGDALEADLDMGVDPCIRYEIVTPGKTIQEGLSKSLGAEVDEYVAAEDLDAIFGALMNQLIGSAFKATGLFSGGRSNPNYYQNQFRQQVASGTFNAYAKPTTGVFAENSPISTGVNCNTPSDPHYIQNYTLSANDTAVMFFDKTRTPPAWVDITNGTDPFVANPNLATVADYQQAANYCAQNPSWQAAQATIDNLEDSIVTASSNQCSQQSRLYSTDYKSWWASSFDIDRAGGGGGANYAIDNTTETYARVNGGSLEFILNKPETLSSIQIQTYDSSFPLYAPYIHKSTTIIPSIVKLYATETSQITLTKSPTSNTANFVINLIPPTSIQKIRIEQPSYDLYVSELTLNRYVNPIINWSGANPKVNEDFDVLGGDTATKCADNSALPNSSVSFTIDPLLDFIVDPTNANLITFQATRNYIITYTVNDGVTSASFTRTVTVRN
ncbi:MAG: hypothetical protein WC673_01995 [Candidatus Paceibacterota bacterium]|jgi:hypothetical protein